MKHSFRTLGRVGILLVIPALFAPLTGCSIFRPKVVQAEQAPPPLPEAIKRIKDASAVIDVGRVDGSISNIPYSNELFVYNVYDEPGSGDSIAEVWLVAQHGRDPATATHHMFQLPLEPSLSTDEHVSNIYKRIGTHQKLRFVMPDAVKYIGQVDDGQHRNVHLWQVTNRFAWKLVEGINRERDITPLKSLRYDQLMSRLDQMQRELIDFRTQTSLHLGIGEKGLQVDDQNEKLDNAKALSKDHIDLEDTSAMSEAEVIEKEAREAAEAAAAGGP